MNSKYRERKLEYIRKYNKANYKQFILYVNKNTESDLIEHLQSQSNQNGYLKDLIRRDMHGDK